MEDQSGVGNPNYSTTVVRYPNPEPTARPATAADAAERRATRHSTRHVSLSDEMDPRARQIDVRVFQTRSMAHGSRLWTDAAAPRPPNKIQVSTLSHAV
jgi:hypothetical protein